MTHLLFQTDPQARVEREEDERVLHALVEEPVRVELECYTSPRRRRRS